MFNNKICGYGKCLLEIAIDFLNRKNAFMINIIVIKNNSIAYSMYKRRSFKEKSIINHWRKVK
ncbi:hypothetical protein [Clostridium puniceum]|uniref:hypothetical protein n=1 Tax=Clostridium puniceum TaxID=29367 RepID=UPI00098CD2FF|nr:hypothetical protein [Clostridium puniceum]